MTCNRLSSPSVGSATHSDLALKACIGMRIVWGAYIHPYIASKTRKQKSHPKVAFASKCLSHLEKFWWRFTDSNRGPVDYDSIALTD